MEISLVYWTKILILLFGLSLIKFASRMPSGSRTMMVTPTISFQRPLRLAFLDGFIRISEAPEE
ncbi:hypothetical protein AO268_08970 [Pseudomonas sp. ICMP 8385]|nr:hypothetical protein AO268_08970 [Pseudomonas sp. ICMP 8385]